ncbi:hypothetical protein D0O09_01725 [Pseudomonas putida]|nr:hypothetical protein D0O09_01725 [Pseudomonas putida]
MHRGPLCGPFRRQASSHRYCAALRACVVPVGAGLPAMGCKAAPFSMWTTSTCLSVHASPPHLKPLFPQARSFPRIMWNRLWKTWWHLAQAL